MSSSSNKSDIGDAITEAKQSQVGLVTPDPAKPAQIYYDIGADVPGVGPIDIGDDLSKNTKLTLGAFLRKSTDGSSFDKRKNKYPISKGQTEFSIQTQRGNPSTITNNSNVENRFLNPGDTAALSQPQQMLATDFFSKGKNDYNSKYDGNTLLTKAVPTELNEKYINPVLSNNRFTPDTRLNDTRIVSNQKELGKFNKNGKDVSLDNLKKIGSILSMRATGELNANDDGYDPDSFSASAAALLPGKAQLGLRLDSQTFDTANILKSIIGEDFGHPDGDPISRQTYGNLNNVNEPFDSLFPVNMVALATALILAAQVALKALTVTLSIITNTNSSTSKRDSLGRYFIGKYHSNVTSDSNFPPPSRLLGLEYTTNPFNDCVTVGINILTGANADSVGISATGAFGHAQDSPGFYAILIRSLTRSIQTIGIVGSSITSPLKNPIQTATSTINLIDTIRRSKVIGMLNVLAKIGDIAISVQNTKATTETVAGVTKMSTIDAMDDDASHSKNRLDGRLKLAWSNNRSPSTFILPDKIYGAGMIYKSIGNTKIEYLNSVKSENAKSKNQILRSSSNRLGANIVEDIETKLDAEYMPFYFHDLRTNEIISFHAFLNSLSDSFTPAWETHEAYGRIDDIKIYKNTKRKLSLGFISVATSKQDFDEMWFKINKLITMIYPQYSKGTVLSPTDDVSFIQPFSQIPTASPLIRLRLGDVIKTNYSKFALARLFGLGTDLKNGKSIDESSIKKALNSTDTELKKLEQIAEGQIFWINPGTYEPNNSNILGSTLGAKTKLTISTGNKFKVKINDISKKDRGIILAELDTSWTPNKTNFGELLQGGLNGGFKFKVSIDDLSTDSDFYSKKSNNSGNKNYLAATDEDAINKISDFLSEENNAIVKAFLSTKGKGLAGVIDNLEIDHLNGNNFPWSTEFGSKAPKLISITLGFSPIHDIPPGIDFAGFNCGAIYNVGDLNKAYTSDGWDEEEKGKKQANAVNAAREQIQGIDI
jgi:hypothetical protein